MELKKLLELAISHKNIPKSKIRGGCTISFLKDARGIKNDSQNETQNLLTTEIYWEKNNDNFICQFFSNLII